MILEKPILNYQHISRISPSNFTALKGCHYKFIINKAIDGKPVLPVSINSYKGTFVHRILEHISLGKITSEEELSSYMDNELNVINEQILRDGNSIYVPLHSKLKNFGLLKIKLKRFLIEKSKSQKPVTGVKFSSEKWYETNDKLVGGKIDLISEYPDRIEIIDFKTGAITEELLDDEGEKFEEVKIDYQDQLKLYAALFHEQTGKKVDRLFLVDLQKNKYEISFSFDECNKLIREAKKILIKVNEEISTRFFLADPKIENCKFCLNRPACSYYKQSLINGLKTNDISGRIIKSQKFLNGNVSLFLQTQIGNVTIKNFGISFFESFNKAIGKEIIVYNVRADKMENSFLANQLTRVYES
ncbi:Inactivated superfamily I helicase [Chryseobacterium nakagawai]|uniref:PD-(D/E)XK nuclease family protein n=1 Tax=Chryseobacterium nakagawai TaxID=1241982 RepID=A0AAD1DT59_CHRNA|nr:PD-(D/E)XK nuclease family protein [Chryseobacterium nakagawai]AZA93633.1 PD-(D/E)XK nuclease family protein [Chryseobacterium nakagawai]VEH20337.1 Inactivated superfamily I helicase [Chryseobacterium nakagawai]